MKACFASMVCVTALGIATAAQTPAHKYFQSYPTVAGETLLDNERLVVQRFVIPPGGSEGNHTHTGNQLWIQMTPGEWTSRADKRVSRIEAGTVGWQEAAIARAEDHEGGINSGSAPIELLWVTLKPVAASATGDAMKHYRLVYPNIPGTLQLDNDHVVVQRFVVRPGEWEGVHAHPGNQLYVHVKGGRWAVRTGGRENVSTSKTGSIGWYHAIPLSEQHQSGNAGDEPIDLIWVTLKK